MKGKERMVWLFGHTIHGAMGYRIMVVEDKSTIRKGIIKMMDIATHGIESVIEASSGSEALELAKSNKLHIIVTDIRMPDGDGLTLLSQVRNLFPDIQTIVISGYDDFDFVKKAMIYGSVNYILKPTDPIELNESIAKAISIIKEREKGLYDTNGKKIKYFQRKIKNEEVKEESDFMQQYKRNLFCVAVTTNSDLVVKNSFISEKHYEVFQFKLGKIEVLLFSENSFFDAAIFEKRVTEDIVQIQRQGNDKELIKFGIGAAVLGDDNLKHAYDTAIEALTYTMFMQNSMVSFNQIGNRKEYSIHLSEIENDLILKVTSGNDTDTVQILNRLFENTITEDASVKTIKKMLLSLCLVLNKLDTGLSEEIIEFSQKINNPEYILLFQSFDRIKELVCNLFRFTAREYVRTSGSQKGLVEKVKEYIQINFGKPISLESIAEDFHINASYLSSQFKKYTGKNFNFYLNEIRIEKAKDFLVAYTLNLQQISELTGYKDQVHFCKVFKKLTGMTPKQYKAMRQGDKV